MSYLKKFLILLIPSLLLTSNSFALNKEQEETLLDSLVDVMALKDDCINVGSGFYLGDDLTVISVNHITRSKRCGDLDIIYVDAVDKRFDLGIKRAVAYSDGPILIDVILKESSKPSRFLKIQAKTIRINETVYIPVINFDNSTKAIVRAKFTGKARVVNMKDEFGIIRHKGLLVLSLPTDEGSSGSPVVNEQLEVVGIVVGGNREMTFCFPVSNLVILPEGK